MTMTDWRWDRKLKIHTRGRDSSREDADRYPYEPTPYAVLDLILESGWITKEDVLMDYGCGKGRVSLFFAALTGCRCIGIDFNEHMIRQAKKNQDALGAAGSRTRFLLADAVRFQVPEEANRFFFFNPFSLRILKEVLRHILDSWYKNPRPMALLFYYPSDEYAALLARTIELDFQDELDCSALFPGNPRERVLCYTLPGPESVSSLTYLTYS